MIKYATGFAAVFLALAAALGPHPVHAGGFALAVAAIGARVAIMLACGR